MSITNKITVKRAEIAVAVILALCSIALMIKSAENRITWNAEENMGAGFLPFYLSLGMLICTILTIIKFVLKRSPQSKDDTPFIDAVATASIKGVSSLDCGDLFKTNFIMVRIVHMSMPRDR